MLNDRTAVGALRLHDSENGITQFLLDEASRNDSIEIIGDDDLDPFRRNVGFFESRSKIKAFDNSNELVLDRVEDPRERSRLDSEFRSARQPLFEEINVLEAQAYILFADKLEASYIPDRLFGYEALERYPEVINKSPHTLKDEFLRTLQQRFTKIHLRDPDIKSLTPSFLFEALKSSETAAGISSALRDLRYSAAAKHYREMVRTMTDIAITDADRQKAYEELDAQTKAAFSKEGLESRIPRMIKLTLALSSFAVAILFPPAAAAPLLLEAADETDRWLRKRKNIFQHYPAVSYEDLHAELKRLFPHVKFEAEHLAHFLQTRNFGLANTP